MLREVALQQSVEGRGVSAVPAGSTASKERSYTYPMTEKLVSAVVPLWWERDK